ncbi:MAG: hypothetical protein E6Q97_28825 [Desulfurellales bacterium]|nr:MAG: hypothetical protein E6Q97_28825 [Desulfurellales bacterium]
MVLTSPHQAQAAYQCHASYVDSTLSDPWRSSANSNHARRLTGESRPTEEILRLLRGRVESGCPFDLARRTVGVTDTVHEAWMERGLALHEREPDRKYRPDGTTVIGGSLQPEAEYVRIFTVGQAESAAKLVLELNRIARDPSRKRDQLTAIQMLLRALGEKAFDPRTESEVTLTTRSEPDVDQASLDALSPDQRKALVERARAASKAIAEADATLAGQSALPPSAVIEIE